MQEYISQAISGAKIAAKGYAVTDKTLNLRPTNSRATHLASATF